MKAIKFELTKDLKALILEDATTFERIGTIEKWERVNSNTFARVMNF